MRPRVLVVDDEPDLAELIELTLVGMGLDVDVANDLASALRFVDGGDHALCLTDMKLPDGSGLDLIARIAQRPSSYPVAVLTAFGSAETAVSAFKAGAFDYLAKPVALDALRALVRSALRRGGAAGAGRLRSATGEPAVPASAAQLLLGSSPAIGAVRETIARMARSMAPVAITGESGSGKELAARSIHLSSGRADGPFVAVNCGAIPENLMESEFFGHRKGSFTGADSEREGFFAAASGGTLFLDEVADLPLPMQVKLLRAIQEKRVRKVGATHEEPVDVRILSATHQDLARCVRDGRFRQDLYYRLNVIELRMPPLRERPGDILPIAQAILARVAARAGLAGVPELTAAALHRLQAHPFAGNVRELENVLERAVAFADTTHLDVADLGLAPLPSPASGAMSGAASGAEFAPSPGPAGAAGRDGAVPHGGVLHGASLPASLAHAPAGFADRVPAGALPRHDTPPASAPAAAWAAGTAAVAAAAPTTATATDAAADPATMGSAGQQQADAQQLQIALSGDVPASLTGYLDAIERDAIRRALLHAAHNRTAAARLLGITFRTLRYRMQKLDMRGTAGVDGADGAAGDEG